ncbi:hypothetical protein SAMN05428960_0320 [Mitsuaria sp. PDC51]|uniref:hypothetical protein n=1 Tax=Mitsuaria sp. PDC51 TaxID=1881035 RepID=UPI0008E9DAD4|nr:hypothetical protein [Mitsuaria sp. PDC51]SFR71084.1 hypothetical protein SAMN05428960_0320 [Mitsuaria sp. PDC51]
MIEERLEVHYHLLDGAHSMDALVRNKCEAELLALVRHLAGELGLDVTVETAAYADGGLREYFRLIIDPAKGPPIVGVAMLLLAFNQLFVQVLSMPAAPDKEQEALTKELTKLSIEEKKLQIQKLQREAAQDPPAAQTIRETAKAFNEDYKVVTRRSNFYKQLIPYQKVFAVGFGIVPTGAAAPVEETVTQRSEFSRYIITSDKLPELVGDEAVIEIVAPVITGGNMHWKGLHNGEVISFAMRDTAFKEAVSACTVSFQHGDAIVCVLHVERKLDPVGEVVITGRYVSLVYEKRSATGVASATPQGRKKRFEGKHANSQAQFSFDGRGTP